MEIDNKLLDEYFSFTEDDLLNVLNENKKEVEENKEMIDYQNQTGEAIPDYVGMTEGIIEGTGTDLDGKTIEDVSYSKDASPKQIIDLSDCLHQIVEGGRAALSNVFDLGGEALTAVFDPFLSKDNPKLTEEEKESLNPFGSKTRDEATSYASDFVGGASQFATGALLTAPLFGPVGSKATALKSGAVKAIATKPTISTKTLNFAKNAFVGTLKIAASDTAAFSEAQQNFSETIDSLFGITPAEFLEKKPDDPYFTKKFKNAADASTWGLIIGGLFKLGNVLYKTAPVQKAVEFSVKKPTKFVVETAMKPLDYLADKTVNKLFKSPLESTLDSIESAMKATDKEPIVKAAKDKTAEVVGEEVSSIFENKVKMLSKEQVNKIANQCIDEGLLEEDFVRTANETVLKDSISKTLKFEKVAKDSSDKAEKIITLIEAGEASDKAIDDSIVSLVKDFSESYIEQRGSRSGAAVVEAVASKNEAVKTANKFYNWLQTNVHKIDRKSLLEVMARMKNAKQASLFFEGMAEKTIARGGFSDFVGKGSRVIQDFLLLSGYGRLQDVVSTTGFLGMQMVEAAGSAALHPLRKGLTQAIGRGKLLFTKKDSEAAKFILSTLRNDKDAVAFGESLDMLHGAFSLLGETINYIGKKAISKAKGVKFNETNPFAQAVKQSVKGTETRLSLARSNNLNLFVKNDGLAGLVNKIANHGGIYLTNKLDDFTTAIAYRAHLERELGLTARIAGKAKNWTRAQTKEYAKELVLKAKNVPEESVHRIYDYTKGLTEEGKIISAIKEASAKAAETTFRAPLTKGSFAERTHSFVNNLPYIKELYRIAYPFQKTNLKIAADEFLRKRSVVAALPWSQTWKQIASGGRAGDEALGRLATGLGLQASLWYLYKNDIITGSQPSNPNKREMLKSAGWIPFAYKRDDGQYLSLRGILGPVGPMIESTLTFLTRLDEVNEKVDDRVGDEFVDHLLVLPTMFAESAVAPTFIGQILDGIRRGDSTGAQQIARNVSNFAPVFIRETKDLFKETDEDGYTISQTALTELDNFCYKWGFDTTVDEPDIFGEPMYAKKRGFKTLGQQMSQTQADDVLQEMLYQRAYVAPPSQKVTKDRRSILLDKGDVIEWKYIMGELKVKDALRKTIYSYEYKKLSESQEDMFGKLKLTKKQKLISVYNQYKDKAFSILVERNKNVRDKLDAAMWGNRFPDVDVKRGGVNIPTMRIGE